MFRKTLTTLALALGLAAGSHTVVEPTADAKPFDVLSKSRDGGKRTHKRAKSSSSKKDDSKKKKRSSSSRSGSSSSSDRRVVRSRTTRSSEPVRKNVRSRRTVRRTTSRPSASSSSDRTVKNVRPRTTSNRTRTTTTRTRSRTTHRRGSTVRRTTYRNSQGHHHHHSTTRSAPSNHRSSNEEVRGGGKSTVEAYMTGGLGISGFASKQIVDGALPGAGYNLAIGAKGGIFGAELGINGGGYTFEPGSGSTDIGIVGLAGDLKLQPSFGFFEPYVKAGLGAYALADGIVEETATGVGLRLGAGADFRFRKWAFRLSYDHGSYGLQDTNGGLGGDVGARTESLGAALVFYF